MNIRQVILMTLTALAAMSCSGAGKVAQYKFERKRTESLEFSDMVLCYGGSAHRDPFKWTEERFVPYVTCKDPDGKERWMFDSFLFLEFTDRNADFSVFNAYGFGYGGLSAGKEEWTRLLDYWFEDGNGFDALDRCIGKAIARIGKPACRHRVVFSMPDPVLYRKFKEPESGSVYWGEIDGHSLDFAEEDDRVAAYIWFIDQVRRRFAEGKYSNIELAGFYFLSEAIATPTTGYSYELKKTDVIVPRVAEYVTGMNYSFCWIPYYLAAGYDVWKKYGFSVVYMQPNYFWGKEGYSLERFFKEIEEHDLAMELEFDDKVLSGNEDSEDYRRRLREYMAGAKANGVYGKKPLSYYQGNNTVYNLSVSDDPEDIRMYRELCEFVTGNPLRRIDRN